MTQSFQVRYYAQLREALQVSTEELSLDLPTSERAILDRLAEMHPKQRELFFASRVAVEEAYVDADALLSKLADGIDIISPISGG